MPVHLFLSEYLRCVVARLEVRMNDGVALSLVVNENPGRASLEG